MKFYHNQCALVTGAAQGLGRSIASALHSYDCELILVDKNFEALKTFKNDCTDSGAKVHIYDLDLLNHENLEASLKDILANHPSLNIVINNAGTVVPGYFHEVSFEDHKRTIELNFNSLLFITLFFIHHLRAQPLSRLIQVASASALLSFPKASSYAASKWAVLGLSESLYAEQKLLHLTQPRITVACPSFIKTQLFEGAKQPLGTPMLQTDDLALKILKAASKGKFRLVEPWLVKFCPLLKGIMPFPVWQKLLVLLGLNQSMNSWKGQSH